ncbi:MAG: outer membrane protein assembly factor, partial [Bacteroidales bacterium]|nr:outer membrane protein assembly factor [Bacteroidales bacterium]
SLAADWGVGLRLNIDFIVLRFDFGMKVHDPARDEGERWLGPDKWFKSDGCAFHFGVGYPF